MRRVCLFVCLSVCFCSPTCVTTPSRRRVEGRLPLCCLLLSSLDLLTSVDFIVGVTSCCDGRIVNVAHILVVVVVVVVFVVVVIVASVLLKALTFASLHDGDDVEQEEAQGHANHHQIVRVEYQQGFGEARESLGARERARWTSVRGGTVRCQAGEHATLVRCCPDMPVAFVRSFIHPDDNSLTVTCFPIQSIT